MNNCQRWKADIVLVHTTELEVYPPETAGRPEWLSSREIRRQGEAVAVFEPKQIYVRNALGFLPVSHYRKGPLN